MLGRQVRPRAHDTGVRDPLIVRFGPVGGEHSGAAGPGTVNDHPMAP
jgi:hypothetical protein